MFQRLFGVTEEEQLQNLQTKVMLTGVGFALGIVSILLALLGLEPVGEITLSIGGICLFVAMFMWGFGALKTLFGIGTIGAFFSGNVVFGVVIFVFCIMAAYFISLFIALLGIGRFIYLKVKISQEGR